MYATPWSDDHQDNNIPVVCSSVTRFYVLPAGPTPSTVSTLPCKTHPPRDFPRSYATLLQGMLLTHNVKRLIKPLHSISRATLIDSDCCHLPTASALSNKADELCSNQFCSKPKFLKATRHEYVISSGFCLENRQKYRSKENCNTKVHGAGGLEPVKLARDSAPSCQKLCASRTNASEISPVCRSLLALVGRKQTVVRDKLIPQKLPTLRL